MVCICKAVRTKAPCNILVALDDDLVFQALLHLVDVFVCKLSQSLIVGAAIMAQPHIGKVTPHRHS